MTKKLAPHKQALQRAIEKAGGTQVSLAKALNVKQQTVAWWLSEGSKGVAPEYCIRIETITGVSRHDLRPDVFGAREAA